MAGPNKSRREFLAIIPAGGMAAGAAILGMSSPAPGVEVQDEGTVLGRAKKLDFTGGGVTASLSGDKATVNVPTGAGSDSLKVKVTSADTTEDFLNPKIAVLGGLAKSVLNPGANEQLQLDGSEFVRKNPTATQEILSILAIPFRLKRSDNSILWEWNGVTQRVQVGNIEADSPSFFQVGDVASGQEFFPFIYSGGSKTWIFGDLENANPANSKGFEFRANSSAFGGASHSFNATSDQGSGALSLLFGAGAILTASPAGTLGTLPNTLCAGGHRHAISLATLAQLADVAATEDLGVATTFVRGDHRHAHGSGYLPDAHHAQLHEAAHISGGGDAFLSTDLLEAIIKRVRESGGPTDLTVGTIADGDFVKRSGSSLIGGTPTATARESLVAHWTKNITKTNIGTAFVDIYTEAGDGALELKVDFTSKTQYAATINWDYVGTGTHNFRIVQADDVTNVLFDVAVVDGANDVALASLPAWATGTKRLKCQAKSTTAADDPIMRGCSVRLK